MNKRFLREGAPPLVSMMGADTPDELIALMRDAIAKGAEGFCLQLCRIAAEHRTPAAWRRIFAEAEGRPVYVTNYRHHANEGKSDDEIAEELLAMAECGATLCDVMGDLYAPTTGEWTEEKEAVQKQKALIARLHEKGVEVLMSSHIHRFTPAEGVLAILSGQAERGADITKAVTKAETVEEQIENLRITHLLKEKMAAPFLFLSGGECHLSRRLGASLGNCMTLCVEPDGKNPAPIQPSLEEMKKVRELFPKK